MAWDMAYNIGHEVEDEDAKWTWMMAGSRRTCAEAHRNPHSERPAAPPGVDVQPPRRPLPRPGRAQCRWAPLIQPLPRRGRRAAAARPSPAAIPTGAGLQLPPVGDPLPAALRGSQTPRAPCSRLRAAHGAASASRATEPSAAPRAASRGAGHLARGARRLAGGCAHATPNAGAKETTGPSAPWASRATSATEGELRRKSGPARARARARPARVSRSPGDHGSADSPTRARRSTSRAGRRTRTSGASGGWTSDELRPSERPASAVRCPIMTVRLHRQVRRACISVIGRSRNGRCDGRRRVLPARLPGMARSSAGPRGCRWSRRRIASASRALEHRARRAEIAQVELPSPRSGRSPRRFRRAAARRAFRAARAGGREDFRGGPRTRGRHHRVTPLAEGAGMRLEVVAHLAHDGAPISSSACASRWRAAMSRPRCSLPRPPHRLVGTVVRGDGRGRALRAFRPRNCAGRRTQEPASGVYAAMAGGRRAAHCAPAVNVGRLPTIAQDRPLTVEAHTCSIPRALLRRAPRARPWSRGCATSTPRPRRTLIRRDRTPARQRPVRCLSVSPAGGSPALTAPRRISSTRSGRGSCSGAHQI